MEEKTSALYFEALYSHMWMVFVYLMSGYSNSTLHAFFYHVKLNSIIFFSRKNTHYTSKHCIFGDGLKSFSSIHGNDYNSVMPF